MGNFVTGLLVALQGILIVFAVLVILMIVLYIMKLFAKDETQVSANASAGAPAQSQAIADSDEIIAVISAAVAAMSGDDPTKRLRVMSIKRQGSDKPLWSASK